MAAWALPVRIKASILVAHSPGPDLCLDIRLFCHHAETATPHKQPGRARLRGAVACAGHAKKELTLVGALTRILLATCSDTALQAAFLTTADWAGVAWQWGRTWGCHALGFGTGFFCHYVYSIEKCDSPQLGHNRRHDLAITDSKSRFNRG
jgi:hypothetical protein